MRTTLKERVVTVSLEGFETEEMRDIRHRLSDVFGELEGNVSVVVNCSKEIATPEESWFDREIVQENETDDEIFEDAILCVDPFNKRL